MRNASPLLLLLLLAAPGCGRDTTGQTIGPNGDALFGDILVPTDTVEDSADTEFTGTLPPDFGDPCRDNRDCTTNWCVEGPRGFVCTRSCVEACPTGWGCKGITSGGADLVFLCVPDGEIGTDTVGGDTSTVPDTSNGDTGSPTDTGGGGDTGAGDTGAGDTSIADDTSLPPDTTTPPPASLCDYDLGVGVEAFLTETNGDWADCVTGCPNAGLIGIGEFDLGGPGNYTGGLGVLDSQEHTYSVGVGPDIDVIALRAPPRTMIEIAVQAANSGALIDPVVYTSDSFAVRTYNSDVSPTNSCARTTIAFPFVGQSPIFVAIEDAFNYDAWSASGYGPTVGGNDYRYTVRIRTTPFAPIGLGNANPGVPVTLGGQVLTVGGQTQYYSFLAPADVTPTVKITRTGSSEFVPALAVFKSDQNQMVWQAASYDSDGDGVVSRTGGFVTCFGSCGSQVVEYYFAVYDWNGAAGPGSFSYDLRVTVP